MFSASPNAFRFVSAPSASGGRGQATQAQRCVPDKGRIQLYTITKYNMDTMMNFLKKLGFMPTESIRDEGWIQKRIETKSGQKRHYGIFCVEIMDEAAL